MAIAYSGFAVDVMRDKHGRAVSIYLAENQAWDGTETIALFPSTVALHEQVGNLVKGRVVRIKMVTLQTILQSMALDWGATIGTVGGSLDFNGPEVMTVAGEKNELPLPDSKNTFNWFNASLTNPFLAFGSPVAPSATDTTRLMIMLEVLQDE